MGTTTAMRVTYIAGPGQNAGVAFTMAPAGTGAGHLIRGGEVVTIGCYVYRESGAATENLGLAIKSIISAGVSEAVPLGQWVLLRATIKHPSNQGASGQVPGVRISSPSEPGSFIATDMFVVDGVYNGPPFSGADPWCQWVGTPDASRSIGYPPSPLVVRNQIPNPNAVLAANGTLERGGSSGAANQRATDVPGYITTGHRLVPTGVPGNNDSFLHFGDQTPGVMRLELRPGRTYRASGWCYIPAAHIGTLRPLRARTISFFSTTGISNTQSSPAAPNAPGLHWVTFTFTVHASATNGFLRFYNGSDNPADIVVWTGLMLTEGTAEHKPCNGDTPGWRWTGTPSASPSEGYPYTLESAAGVAPLLDVAGANNRVDLPDGGLPAGSPVTMFSVVERVADETIGAFTTFAMYGRFPFSEGAYTHFWMRAIGGGNGQNLQQRWNGGTGPTQVGVFGPGRYVAVAGILPDGRPFTTNGTRAVVAMTLDTSLIPGEAIRTGPASSKTLAPERTLVYPGMDDDTRNAVARWIANAYGLAA